MQNQANNNSSGFLETGNIVKSGYLKKLKTMRKKFFVIWGATETSSARLEYYDNEKKFRLGLVAKKSILLSACFNINKKSDLKHKFTIALYTRDDYFAIVADDEEQQNEWLKILLEQQRASGDGRPIPHFEHVWQVTVKSKGLGSSQNLSGNYRLCLTAGTINLVKMNAENGDLQFSLSVVRRCGHSDCFFFMEVGRQAVTGSGEMWMQVEDSVIAQNIHEATLNAMRSTGQSEDMRPRSHSGSTTTGDMKSMASIARRTSQSNSWRNRCDSLPMPNRAGNRPRIRGNSEGEDGARDDDYANPPSGLLKSSKSRPRTSSEGESHFRSNATPESPSKGRGRHSMPAMRSASVSSGFMRPMSVHRFVTQPISNSPPIPNSPLSESPRSFTDDRFGPGSSHPVGHSPTDVYGIEDHFFGSGYSNGQVDGIKRYPSVSRSRTPESQFPIREESTESTDEYMHMAGTPKASAEEHDSYMDMSSANQTPRSSFSGSVGGISSPPTSPTFKGPVLPKKSTQPPDPGTSTPGEPQGYMMMAPSSGKRRTTVQETEPVPSATSHDSTPYMYMSPPVPSASPIQKPKPKKLSSTLPPSVRLPSTSGSLSSDSFSSSDASNCYSGSDVSAKESTDLLKVEGQTAGTVFDSYANVEFSSALPHTVDPGKGDESAPALSQEEKEKAEYMNMVYNSRTKGAALGEYSSKLSNGVKGDGCERSTRNKGPKETPSLESDKEKNTDDYARMTYNGKEKPVVKVKSNSPKHKQFEGDFMNVDRSMGSSRLSLSSPQSPSSPVSKGSKASNVFSQSLQHSLKELQLKENNTSQMGLKSQSSLLLNRPSSLSGNSPTGTVHPKGSLTPNLNLHHSPVCNANKTKKYELNYIDVEADSTNAPRKSDSSSPLSPPSPFRGALSAEEKDPEPVTYATIDFNKSEGLRNVSAMRESRF